MKIYIAAAFSQKDEVKQKAEELEALGHECTSRWRFQPPTGAGDGTDPLQKETYIKYAKEDLEDIRRANLTVILTDKPSTTGGKHVELGYCLGQSKRVATVGEKRENIFQWLTPEHYETWEEFISHLTADQDDPVLNWSRK
jgi:nucleoside 2-deoxyribosyltransferase